MAHSATYLIETRAASIQSLEQHLKLIHAGLAPIEEGISLQYESTLFETSLNSTISLKEILMNEFSRHRPREYEWGFTVTGPHKDDLDIKVNKKSIRSFGSEGQQRTCISSLKLAEWYFLKESIGDLPLMLVDDFGVSLDTTRREKLLGELEKLGQVFITTTEQSLPLKLKVPTKIDLL